MFRGEGEESAYLRPLRNLGPTVLLCTFVRLFHVSGDDAHGRRFTPVDANVPW